jgi:hypothetical protein
MTHEPRRALYPRLPLQVRACEGGRPNARNYKTRILSRSAARTAAWTSFAADHSPGTVKRYKPENLSEWGRHRLAGVFSADNPTGSLQAAWLVKEALHGSRGEDLQGRGGGRSRTRRNRSGAPRRLNARLAASPQERPRLALPTKRSRTTPAARPSCQVSAYSRDRLAISSRSSHDLPISSLICS